MATGKTAGSRLDTATVSGLLLAVAGIIGGLILEGGDIRDVAQVTAAVIVLGGTLGAVLVNTPLPVLRRAAGNLGALFFEKTPDPNALVEEIIGYATKARKNGIVSLEADAEAIADPFLKKAITLAVDGTDLQEIRSMLELEIAMEEQRAEAEAKVFESAGGYAPTIGIIGAVLGLIQVMKHLTNIDEVGHGIAVAFVATVYGVGLANVFCLPAAGKLRARARQRVHMRDLVVEGSVAIVEGLNPKLIRSKLEAFAGPAPKPAKASAARPRSAQAQEA